jgi:hypothetical protein
MIGVAGAKLLLWIAPEEFAKNNYKYFFVKNNPFEKLAEIKKLLIIFNITTLCMLPALLVIGLSYF